MLLYGLREVLHFFENMLTQLSPFLALELGALLVSLNAEASASKTLGNPMVVCSQCFLYGPYCENDCFCRIEPPPLNGDPVKTVRIKRATFQSRALNAEHFYYFL